MGEWVGGWVGSPPPRRSVVWDPIRGARRGAAPRARAFGRPQVQLPQPGGSRSKTRATKIFHSSSRDCLSVCVFSEGTRRRARARPQAPNQATKRTNQPTNANAFGLIWLRPGLGRGRAARRGAAPPPIIMTLKRFYPKLKPLPRGRSGRGAVWIDRWGAGGDRSESAYAVPGVRGNEPDGRGGGWWVGRGAHA